MYFAANTLMVVGIVSCAVLLWIFCAFSAANMARTNGRSYGLWLVIGLLAGPAGLLGAWAYFRISGERHRRIRHGTDGRYDLPEIITCPGCGQSVPSAFQNCQFCGCPLHTRRR